MNEQQREQISLALSELLKEYHQSSIKRPELEFTLSVIQTNALVTIAHQLANIHQSLSMDMDEPGTGGHGNDSDGTKDDEPIERINRPSPLKPPTPPRKRPQGRRRR